LYLLGITVAHLGIICDHDGDFTAAREHYNRHADIARELGDRRSLAAAMANIGGSYSFEGDMRKSIEYVTKCLEIIRPLNDRATIGWAVHRLGYLHRIVGELDKSDAFLEEAMGLLETIPSHYADCLIDRAETARGLGRPRLALEYLDRAAPLLGTMQRDDLRFKHRLLHAQLTGDIDRREGERLLQRMLDETEAEIERAALTYELARLTRDPGRIAAALEMYEALARDNPNIINQDRIKELRAM
ncbi:tetratricopeptide repeat protein, partial [bacterium]|nr:tetratricopeptide repeat protein [candidate division CSSED10-310 bacterium]